MKHLIIEGFCEGNRQQNTYNCKGTLEVGIECFDCPKFSYTYCPNEIAISNGEGVVEECIGFGGEMEPSEMEKINKYINMWNGICKKKMNEAYEEYFDIKKKSEQEGKIE